MTSVAVPPQAARGGLNLVRATERLYRSLFAGALVYCVVAAAWGLAEKPFNQLHTHNFWTEIFVGLAALALALLGLWQRGPLFELFRQQPIWILAVVAIGIGIMWADGDMDSSFYWFSLTGLALCAVVADTRWVFGYSLVLSAGLVVGLLGVHGYTTAQLSRAGLLDTFGEQLGGYLALGLLLALPFERLAGYVARINILIDDEHPEVSATNGRSGPRANVTAALSAREVEVTQLVAEGLSNEEIGRQLYLSPRTVQTHVASAMRKTATRSRTGLAVAAVKDGLLPLDGSGSALRS